MTRKHRFLAGLGLPDRTTAAALAAYGFNAKRDLLAQLLALNQEVAAKVENGAPVSAASAPKDYPEAKKLVTEDCIRPTEVSGNQQK
jgi:hypothetical protein